MHDFLHYKTPEGCIIEPSTSVRDLGVHLTPDFKWVVQVNKAVQSSKIMANWVLGVFLDRSPDVMITLFNSMVRSSLEYSCPVWNPATILEVEKLESIQRSFTSHINGCKDMSYWDRLKKLDLLSLQRRRERYVILQVWKIIHDVSPNDINIQFYKSDRLGLRCRLPYVPN